MNRNALLALAISGLIITAVVVVTIVYFSLSLRGTGRIKTVGVKAFADPAGTKEISGIDWGEISPGGYAYRTIYLKSTSTTTINLTLSTEAWTPSNASDFLTLSWDYDGRDLNPGEIIAVTLALSVDNAITGITDFSFDIIIMAAG